MLPSFIIIHGEIYAPVTPSPHRYHKLLKIIERDANDAFLEAHGAVLKDHHGSEAYDEALVPVIKAAQESHGLKPDGIIGPRTVAAIAGVSKTARIEKVLYALERLRWHPSELGETRVVINAAAFNVDFFENGKPRLSMRTVVGRNSNQTSFFYDKLETVEFNPYWGVPRSIIVNEMLPKLWRDPSYLDRNGTVYWRRLATLSPHTPHTISCQSFCACYDTDPARW